MMRISCIQQTILYISPMGCPPLELVSEIQVEVGFLGAVAVTDSTTNRTKHGVVVVGRLHAKERATVKQLFKTFCMLCTCKTNQHIVVGAEALLGLQLSSYEVTIDVLHATNACKGHLLLDVVSEVVTTDGITEDRWQDGSEEQTTIEHGLQREATTKGEQEPSIERASRRAKLSVK